MNALNIECFSENMKKTREAMKMTQKELAEKVGLTSTTISAYEKKIKYPSLDNAVLIANSLGVSLDSLCGAEPKSSKPKTYGDIIQAIITVADILRGTLVSHEIIYEYRGGSTKHRVFIYSNNTINNFFEEWEKVRKLYTDKIIDNELYEAWIEKKLREYEINLYNTDGEINDPMPLTPDTDPDFPHEYGESFRKND